MSGFSQKTENYISTPSNIAEGQSRNSFKEFKQFLSIALGSLAEIETQLIIANEIGYLASAEIDKFLVRVDTIRKMIKALTHSLK
ncbi:MAG: four helix bundle protein [Thermodesulfobacteriota bacterium]